MQMLITDLLKNAPEGQEAQSIIRKCVHCGFCTAACPTYQVTGNELESPRGRIYLIKHMLEGQPVTAATRQHLDSCLSCRGCETACPSGVQYGRLIDIGRKVVAERVPRGKRDQLKRSALTEFLGSPMFRLTLGIGQQLRMLLPGRWARRLPARRARTALPTATHARQVLMPIGCVQPSMMPSVDDATLRVLDAVGITGMPVAGAGCCGALRFHMDDQDSALQQMRDNIDAWWSYIESGEVEAIVANASGCGATLHEYGYHLRHDADYADKAERVSAMVRDVAELVAPQAARLRQAMRRPLPGRVAFHPPCTLQHWQSLRPVTETLLGDLGFALKPFGESNLCCGSAGAHSLLNPGSAGVLRDRKLASIGAAEPDMILSSNVGCLSHLQGGTSIPVRHWVEAVGDALH